MHSLEWGGGCLKLQLNAASAASHLDLTELGNVTTPKTYFNLTSQIGAFKFNERYLFQKLMNQGSFTSKSLPGMKESIKLSK